MDTIDQAKRTRYRRHPIAFKREVVIESLQPGASVARIARERGINANQVFTWRKAYREGVLGEAETISLLPVTLCDAPAEVTSQPSVAASIASGHIELTRCGTTLRIEGRPDPDTLRLILAHWPR